MTGGNCSTAKPQSAPRLRNTSGMAAAAPTQGKIITHHQTAQMHGQQIAAHEFLGRQGGSSWVKGSSSTCSTPRPSQQFQPPFPAGQRGVGLVRGDDQTRVRPESHQHAGQIILAADIQSAADQGLVAFMHAVEVADGDAGARQGAQAVHGMYKLHRSRQFRALEEGNESPGSRARFPDRWILFPGKKTADYGRG